MTVEFRLAITPGIVFHGVLNLQFTSRVGTSATHIPLYRNS